MVLSLICPTKDATPWVAAIQAIAPELDLRVWPDDDSKADITFALVWAQPQGIFAQYPNLRVISSMGAGVDNLLKDSSIPAPVAVVRIVDPRLVSQMGDYILAAALNHVRQFPGYGRQQQQRRWQPRQPRNLEDVTVGVMGLGQIGAGGKWGLKGGKRWVPLLGQASATTKAGRLNVSEASPKKDGR